MFKYQRFGETGCEKPDSKVCLIWFATPSVITKFISEIPEEMFVRGLVLCQCFEPLPDIFPVDNWQLLPCTSSLN